VSTREDVVDDVGMAVVMTAEGKEREKMATAENVGGRRQ
jgi:hypothetical protein